MRRDILIVLVAVALFVLTYAWWKGATACAIRGGRYDAGFRACTRAVSR